MLELLRISRALLDPPARRRVVISLGGSIAIAFLDVLSLALVLPFVQSLAAPTSVIDIPIVSDVFDLRGGAGRGQLVAVGGCIIGLFVVRGVFAIVFVRWQFAFLSVSEARMAARLLRRYVDAPYAFHLERNSAELIRNVQAAVPVFFSNVVIAYLTIATDLIVTLAVSVALIVQEPGITALAVVLAAIVGYGYQRWSAPRALHIGSENNRFAKESHQHIQQTLDGVKEVKSLGREREFVEVFHSTRVGWATVKGQQYFLQQLPRYYVETAMMVIVLAISLALISTRPGDEALAVLALFAAAGFRLMASLNRILQSLVQLKVGTEQTKVVKHDFDTYQSLEATDSDLSRLELRDALRIDGVVFRYATAKEPALNGISLQVRLGEFIGIVGRSGSGKTTLVDVILGLLEPESGSVTVDAVDISTELRAWRQTIGYVPQTIYLTDDSLRRNIAFGLRDDEVDDAAIGDAIRRAQLTDLVAELPNGVDTFVGERGVRLSGGQRQRIGIARALYRRPAVLVLDEATSALDADTESLISDTLEELRGSVTVITIAHRLSTVRACDRLMLLENGRLAAEGSFDELEATHPGFARLVQLSNLVRSEQPKPTG